MPTFNIPDGYIETAWRDFLTDMDREYPADQWPNDRLHETRGELLAQAGEAASAERYTAVKCGLRRGRSAPCLPSAAMSR
jgi:hypothetical protein